MRDPRLPRPSTPGGAAAGRPPRPLLRGHVAEGEPGAEDAGLAGGDRQPQTVAAAGPVAAPRAEAAGAVAEQVAGEARAVVADLHVRTVDADLDGRPTVPRGVRQQVAQDALQPPGVGADDGVAADGHRRLGRRGRHPAPHEVAQRHVLQVGLLGRAVQPGDLQHVLHERAQRLRPVPDQLRGAPRRQQLGRGDQPRHRGAQLMGDVRGDPALRLQPAGQGVRHGVHGPRQLVRLVADPAADRLAHPYVRLPVGHPARGLGRLAQPPGQLPADEHAQRRAAHHDRRRADDQGLVQVLKDREAVGEGRLQRQDLAVLQRGLRPHHGRAAVVGDVRGPLALPGQPPQRRGQVGVVQPGVHGQPAGGLVDPLGELHPLVLGVPGVVDHACPGRVVHDQAQHQRDQRRHHGDRHADLPAQPDLRHPTAPPRGGVSGSCGHRVSP